MHQVEEFARPKSNERSQRSPSETPKTDYKFKESFIFDQSMTSKSNTSNIKVYIRFRPVNCIESEARITGRSEIPWTFPTEDTVELLTENAVFTFDRVFPPDASQEEVYQSVGFETVTDVLNGYNGTLFTYGQTGSGKSFTMFGEIMQEEKSGIIPRAIKHICEYIKEAATDSEYTLTCSMVEIYRENLADLLCKTRGDLKIKENKKSGIYIDGLTKIIANNEKELFEILNQGSRNRSITSTRLNTVSSRSHTIFMLEIKQSLSDDSEKRGILNLVDLAGSENNGKSGAVGETLEEAKKINLSLTCLGKVIQALSTQNREHVPYRESKLTRILQESLGGNFKTSLIVTCSSFACSSAETLSSLKFASRTSAIKNRFRMNIKTSPEALQAVIKRLREELIACKGELSLYRLTPASIMEKDGTIVRCSSEFKNGMADCSQERVDKIKLEPEAKTRIMTCSAACESRKKADYLRMEENAFLKERLKQVLEMNNVLLEEKRNIMQGGWHALLAQDKLSFFNAHLLDESARSSNETVILQLPTQEPQASNSKNAENLEPDFQLCSPFFQQSKTPILLQKSTGCSECEIYKLQLIRSHLMNQNLEGLLYDLESRQLEEIIKYKTLYETSAVELKGLKYGFGNTGKNSPSSGLSQENDSAIEKPCIKRSIMDMMDIFQQQGNLPSCEKLEDPRKKENAGLFINCALALEQQMEGLLSSLEEERIKSLCLEESVSLLKSNVIRFKSLFMESETQKRKLLSNEREKREELETKIKALLKEAGRKKKDASTQYAPSWLEELAKNSQRHNILIKYQLYKSPSSQRDGSISAESRRAREVSPSEIKRFWKLLGRENLSPLLSHRKPERNYETEKKSKNPERIMTSNALSPRKMPFLETEAYLGSFKDLDALTRSQALRRK